jgi:hypothetical protein
MPRKTSGDNFPLDLKGEMLFVGSIVTAPYVVKIDESEAIIELRLGYVAKLTQKNGLDVVLFLNETADGSFNKLKVRFRNPARELLIIAPELLKTRDKLHEAIRMDAAMST